MAIHRNKMILPGATLGAEIYFEKVQLNNGKEIPERIRLAYGLETRLVVDVVRSEWEPGTVIESGKEKGERGWNFHPR